MSSIIFFANQIKFISQNSLLENNLNYLRIFEGEFAESKAVILRLLVARQKHRVDFQSVFSGRGPVLVALDPAPFHHRGQHHDQGALRLEHHLPEVGDRVWKRALRCYVPVDDPRAWNLHVDGVGVYVVSTFALCEYHSCCIVCRAIKEIP